MEKIIKEENPFGYKPVGKLLASMAIPAVVANLVNALYNIVDQIFIGQGVGYLGECRYEYCISNYDNMSGNRAYDGNRFCGKF